MERLSQLDVTVHCCFYCEGIWLKQNIIDSPEIDLQHRNLITHILATGEEKTLGPGQRKCPECHGMRLIQVCSENFCLDQCTRCHGVFLDKVETAAFSTSKKVKDTHIFVKNNQVRADYYPVAGFFYHFFVVIHFIGMLWILSIATDYEIFDEHYCYHGHLGEGFVYLWLMAPFTFLPFLLVQAGSGYYLAVKRKNPGRIVRYWIALLIPFPGLMVMGILPCFW